MQTSMRKSEWCQDRHILKKGQVISNKDDSASIFILHGFTFEKPNVRDYGNSMNILIHDAAIVKLK